MPSTLTITMQGDSEKRHGASMASLLQGVIMEQIDPAYAQKLHESAIHPYSQFTEERDGRLIWCISALNTEAEEELLGPLQNSLPNEFALRQRQERFTILGRSLQSTSYEELVEGFYLGDCSRNLFLRIRTPMAFRQGGRYCIFPTVRLLFQNLMLRFDACSPESRIFTQQMLEDFEALTEIADYRLRSVRFSLEGVRIPSFTGDLRIRIRGPQQMANTAWLLAKFGEYSGIGIKTGIGMGAFSISPMVDVDGTPCLDGGCSCKIPYRWALEEGFDKIVVVRTREPEYRKKVSKRRHRHRFSAYGRYPGFAASLANSNRDYNRQCDEIQKLEKEGRIFVIAPSEKVTVGRLEGDMEKLGDLYWLGYNDTINLLDPLRRYLGAQQNG